MQKTKEHKRVTQNSWKDIPERNRLHQGVRSRGKGKKNTSSIFSSGNDFLNERFAGISNVPKDSEINNFLIEESRDYLFLCFSNYLSLFDIKFDVEKTDNYLRDINEGYNRFCQFLPDEIYVNLDLYENGGMLYPTIYHFSKAFRDRFIFFPISVIEKMERKIADVFCHFISFLAKSQHIHFPEDHEDFSWVLGDVIEEQSEYDPEGDNSLVETGKDYNNGNIRFYLNEIKKTITTPDIIINRCYELLTEVEEQNKKLLDIIIQGIELLKSDCIMNYDYNPEYSDDCLGLCYDDVPPVDIHRTWCIVWKHNDAVSDYVCECINQEFYNTYCPGFIQYLQLKPDTSELFQISDYPKKLEEWYDKIFDIITEYGTNK